MKPSRGLVEVNRAAGLHECPVCGGGVGLLPWASVKNLVWAEVPAEKVPRIRPHYYGGTPKTNKARERDRCEGTYMIPRG